MLANLDPLGGARMVDVTPREPTHRRALARCRVSMLPETTTKVANNAITKGDVLAAARIAGIQAAKRTAELIPMCHPVLVGSIGVNFSIGDDYVEVEAQVETRRPHRRRDGGDDRLRCRRAHRLRHVQVGGPHHDGGAPGAVGEVRRPVRALAPARGQPPSNSSSRHSASLAPAGGRRPASRICSVVYIRLR